jgi:two-component system sensor histidine kinase/response regulator
MERLLTKLGRFEEPFNKLVGNAADIPIESRAFHTVCVLTMLVLVILLPINIWLQMPMLVLIIAMLIGLLSIAFYLSRYANKYKTGLRIYLFFAHVSLIGAFYYDAGSHGPSLLLFFLSFMLQVVVTPRSQHIWVAITHLFIAITLLTLERVYPNLIPNIYQSEDQRFIDYVSTYVVSIGFVYGTIIYLRNNYVRERKIAILRLHAIEKQNKQLEELNNEKNKLFSIISHDLRSPLNSIQSYLEVLGMQGIPEEDKVFLEGSLRDLTKNTSDMLYNLLVWSKAQMDGIKLSLRELPLYGSLHNILIVEKSIATKKGIKLTYDIAEDIIVRADSDMLELVVRNLLNNAIKFTKSGGSITLKTHLEKGACVICITDTGIGMTKEVQADVFKMKHINSFGTNNEKGVGLGLALCKEFVELQGGEIWFKSEQGKGTKFCVSMPLVQP